MCGIRRGASSFAEQLTGVDINPDCIQYAKENCRTIPGIRFVASDYRAVQFTSKPDIIFTSLFCHHFTDDELVVQLQWLHSQASIGFVLNDLHRHPLAHYSIQWLTKLFSRSYLVKNDAPLSVLRGFTKKEWQALFHKAGIHKFDIHWKWAFRWLVVSRNTP